jgi:hypothetical protein
MTTETTAGSLGELKNPDLAMIHRQLVGLVTKLDLAIDDAVDAAQVKVLTEQIEQTNVRVSAIGRELFAHSSEEISAAAVILSSRFPQIEEALVNLAKIDALVTGVTGMLKLADAAVELARRAA